MNPLATLGIQWKLFLAQLVNISVVAFVLWRWAYRPLLQLMQARAEKIRLGLAEAEEAKQRLAQAEREQTEIIRAAKQQAQAVMQQAQMQAESEREDLKQQTKIALERQLDDARTRLKQEKLAMVDSLKREMAGLVIQATQKVTAETQATERQKTLIEQAVAETTSVL